MATIPVPGSELRHVRKTVTFTGGAGAGAVGMVKLFPVTGAVIIERLVPFCTVDMVSATSSAEIALTDADDASGPYSTTTASAIDAGFLWDRASGDNGWGFDAVSVGSVFVAYKDVCLKITIEDITAGAMRFDVWYRPITDDGALAGDDIDSALVDAVWDEPQSGHTTAGTFGRYLDSQLATIASYIDTEIAAIKAKTDSLTFTVAGIVDSNVVDWKGSAAPANTGDAFARLGAPAGASVSADIATVATYVDTEVAAIKAVTDNLPNSGALSTIQSDLDDIQTRLPAALVGGRMDSSVGAMAAAVITAAAIATDAIDADALAADAVTEIWAKAMSELASVPAVNGTVLQALEWIFLLARNKLTQTATTQTLRNDADNATIGASAVSDDGSTFTRGEWA